MKRKRWVWIILVFGLGVVAAIILASMPGEEGLPPNRNQILVTTNGNIVVQQAPDATYGTPTVIFRASGNPPVPSTNAGPAAAQ